METKTIMDLVAQGVAPAVCLSLEELAALSQSLERGKAIVQQELDTAREVLQEAVGGAESIKSGSLDLEREREELERLKAIASRIGAEVDELKIELAAAPRVSRLDLAIPKEGKVGKKVAFSVGLRWLRSERRFCW